MDAEALAAEIARCRAAAAAHGISFRCHLRDPETIRRTYDDPEYAPIGRCLSPWMMCRVDPFGDVIPCTGSRRRMGNVRETPIGAIWNGGPYRAALALRPEPPSAARVEDLAW